MSGRGPAKKMKVFQNILAMLTVCDGNQVSVDDIVKTFPDLKAYRMSNYIWNMKTRAGAVIRPVKFGKRVTAYQLKNPSDIANYFSKLNKQNANI